MPVCNPILKFFPLANIALFHYAVRSMLYGPAWVGALFGIDALLAMKREELLKNSITPK